MKRLTAITGLLVLFVCLLFCGCRPLQKGETERCPSCGVEYPAGSHHDCPLKKKSQ